MKKRLVYLIFTTIVMIAGINNVNAANDELKTCTQVRTYYFNYRSRDINNGKKMEITHEETNFYNQLPEGAEVVKITKKSGRAMTQSEYQEYLALLNSNMCETLANGVITCSDDANHRYTNTGLEGQKEFKIIDASRAIFESTFSVGTITSSGTTITMKNLKRTYKVPSSMIKKIKNDKDYEYAVPAIYEILIEYKSEDCQEPNYCGESNNKTPGKLSCSDGNYKYTESVNINTSREISSGSEFNYYSQYFGTGVWCDGNVLSETITASATINQEGYASFSLAPRTIYSGGGFNFSASYSGTISYQFCSEPSYTVTRKYYEEYCPTGATDNGDGTCTSKLYNQKRPRAGYDCEFDDNKCPTEEDAKKKNCYFCEKQSPKITRCIPTSLTFQNNTSKLPYNGGENELEKIYSYMAKNHLQDVSTPETSTVKSKDSNKVTSGTKADTPMGSDWNGSFLAPTSWKPDTKLTLNLIYNTKKACINVKTAKVTYKYTCDEGTEIEGNATYYTPLKQKDNTKFPVSVYIDNVSMTPLVNWKIDYECDVTCRQKLYEDPKGYKFIYRPIQLGAVNAVFPNRTPGANWTNISNNQSAWISKMTKRDKLEYSTVLTVNDIANLKNFTDYADFRTMKKDGTSTSNYVSKARQSNVTYNQLGVCTKECW